MTAAVSSLPSLPRMPSLTPSVPGVASADRALAAASVEELATAAVRGDANAFGELIERHERAALATAYACCGDGTRAADAVQEACLLAWRKRSTLAEPAKFGGWLMGIVRRCAVDQVRRGGMRLPPPEMAATSAAPADDDLDRRERGEQVKKALADLDEATRVAVAMRYYDDSSSREIAEALGCSPAAVDMRLKRARDTLRGKLSRWFTED